MIKINIEVNSEIKRDEFGRFVKGITPWNKNKTGVYSEEILKRMSDAKKGYIPWNKGLKLLDFHPWNKGLKGILKPNKASFKKGRILPKEIEEKRLRNLKEKNTLKPNLEMNEDLAYTLGVIKGDGYVTRWKERYIIGLKVTNKDFANSFLKSLRNIGLNPFIWEMGPPNQHGKLRQHVVTAYSKVFGLWYKELTLNKLKELLIDKKHIASFIRGFYEAEGSIYLRKPDYRYINIRMFNTNKELLDLIKNLSTKIGVNFNLNGPYKNNLNTFGGGNHAKQIYVLSKSAKNEILRFMDVVNPCIKNISGVFNDKL